MPSASTQLVKKDEDSESTNMFAILDYCISFIEGKDEVEGVSFQGMRIQEDIEDKMDCLKSARYKAPTFWLSKLKNNGHRLTPRMVKVVT